ncbi:fatty acid desaturase family protein [Aurantimonas marianensis]|uniref:Fatty acid desaturase n=1 Tax=Aurantimonas marianensis TaxID=2920428 RepID=A0A9X2HAU2_9HYPH|nr:fatty acid desaturase [Aurantimonas marianensis]MCP3055007.1 fatty acid desaturase [Aurantimonas marianensis]
MTVSSDPPVTDFAPAYALSLDKLAGFLVAVAALVWSVGTNDGPLSFAATLGLAVLYAHGLELQHEALHGIFLRGETANRLAGSLLGAPMLASFTDTRVRHLHHHRHVGTPADVFDRSCRDFADRRALVLHVFEPARLPMFLRATFVLARGGCPGPFGAKSRARARTEHLALAALAIALIVTGGIFAPRLLVLGWLVPAFLIAPPLHFLMTAPDRLGRDPASRDLTQNTRSYRAPALWSYLVNYDNYHLEHHRYPALPFHRLPAVHARRMGENSHRSGYGAALREGAAAIAACRRTG